MLEILLVVVFWASAGQLLLGNPFIGLLIGLALLTVAVLTLLSRPDS
jgi:hypothetical protein